MKRRVRGLVGKNNHSRITRQQVLNFIELDHKLDREQKVIATNLMSMKEKYSDDVKEYAASFYISSPTTYRKQRKSLHLPSVDTVRRYINSKLIVKPGISDSIHFQIKSKIGSDLKPLDRPVSLMLDEISLKSRLEFDPKEQKLVGLEDFGVGKRTGRVAKYALCAMIQGIANNYKQLIGYVFSSSPTPATELRPFVFETIEKINSTGLKVVNITTDQGKNFGKFFRDLGVTQDDPFFNDFGYPIHVTADVPHLLKSARNCIYSNVMSDGEGNIHWGIIMWVFDSCTKSEYSYIPRVTLDHVDLPAFGGKMKVKFATQVLSRSMSVAIKTLLEQKLKLISKEDKIEVEIKDAISTAEFCENFNDLFDILNSSYSQQNRTENHKPLRINSESWKRLDEIKNWLLSLKVLDSDNEDKSNRFTFLQGFIQTINATKLLMQDLVANFGFEYLYTRHFCQDALENTFSTIRRFGGCNDSPTCRLFEASFLKAATMNVKKISKVTNCEGDATKNLLTFRDCKNTEDIDLDKCAFMQPVSDPLPLCTVIDDIKSDKITKDIDTNESENPDKSRSNTDKRNNKDKIDENVIRYVGGFIARMLHRKHKRMDCKTCDIFAGKSLIFQYYKEYNKIKKQLCTCSESFF